MATYKEMLAQYQEMGRKIEEMRGKEQEKGIAKIREMIEELGITQEQIFPRATGKRGPAAGSGSSLKGMKLPALYRDPDDKSLTWTGRGQTPKWMKARIEGGMKKEDLKIK